MTTRRRLDAEMVRRGLAPSRTVAAELIGAGSVTVGGAPAAKAARLVAPDEPVEVLADQPPFVSRAGAKLDGALDRFGIDVAGLHAVDAGASTGGFTDCLLQRGTRRVLAVDVGHGQLHTRLRGDDRVVVLERTDVRDLTPSVVAAHLGAPARFLCADLSFISLRSVLAGLTGLVEPGSPVVLLVKPQFEAGRVEASRGRGVIADPDVWRRVLGEVADAARAAGLGIMDAMASTVKGTHGNVEFLLHAVAGTPTPSGPGAPAADAALDAAVAEALARAAPSGDGGDGG
jgi:23S rRNA (cytidine1920-2'-O)/16S rRNA (cytidine1409-2'-O)-methyltransferase